MKPAVRPLAFGLFLAFSLVCAAPQAWACTCAPQSFEDAVRSASAIFEGVVIAVEPIDGDDEIAPMRLRVRLRVVQTWTPGLAEEITITTAAGSAACGYGFEVGHGYLVLADGGRPEAPVVSICGGTKPRAQADQELLRLGMGVVPVSPSERTVTSSTRERRGGCASCSVGAQTSSNGTSAMIVMLMTLAYVIYRGVTRFVARDAHALKMSIAALRIATPSAGERWNELRPMIVPKPPPALI